MNVQAKQEAALSNDLNVITAEINAYKRVAGEAIFEIGRRLKDVRDARSDSQDPRECLIAQQREDAGGWIKWLEEHVEFTRMHAHRFITVYEQFGDDVTSWLHVGSRALYEIATLPPEERDRPHTIPSTGETKTVDEMTVRELREVKAELKREREARQRVCIEINRAEAKGLFAEAERRKDAGRREGGRGKKKNLTVTSPESFETRQIIAARSGAGEQVVQRALTIKRKRPDLYQRLFNGYDETGKEVKIGTVYAQMKRDEAASSGSFIRDDCGCSGYTIPHRLTPSAGRGYRPVHRYHHLLPRNHLYVTSSRRKGRGPERSVAK